MLHLFNLTLTFTLHFKLTLLPIFTFDNQFYLPLHINLTMHTYLITQISITTNISITTLDYNILTHTICLNQWFWRAKSSFNMVLPQDLSTACKNGTLSTVQALVEAGDTNIDAKNSVIYYYYFYYLYWYTNINMYQ